MARLEIKHSSRFFFTWLSSCCASLNRSLYLTTSPFICWLCVCSVLIRWRISLFIGPYRGNERRWGKTQRKKEKKKHFLVLESTGEISDTPSSYYAAQVRVTCLLIGSECLLKLNPQHLILLPHLSQRVLQLDNLRTNLALKWHLVVLTRTRTISVYLLYLLI